MAWNLSLKGYPVWNAKPADEQLDFILSPRVSQPAVTHQQPLAQPPAQLPANREAAMQPADTADTLEFELDETEEEAEEPTQLEWELDEDDGPPPPQPPPQQLTQPSQPQPQQPPQQPSVAKPPEHQLPLPEEEPPTPLPSNSDAGAGSDSVGAAPRTAEQTALDRRLFALVNAGRVKQNQLESLVKSGADVNYRNPELEGATPLLIAAANADANATGLMLGLKADPDLAADDGCTPLMAAALARSTGVVSLLLEAGATRDARNGDGRTALEEVDSAIAAMQAAGEQQAAEGLEKVRQRLAG